MTTRVATGDDVEAIRQVAERAWEADYPDVLTRETAETAVTDWYDPGRLATEIGRARTLVLVGERDGVVVGFSHGTWNYDAREGYILRMYVHPDHRRAGIGRELLERTCVELAGQGVERVNAMVLAENEPGNAFYEHFGFECADQHETTIGDAAYRENRYVLDVPRDDPD
ncbi:MAG: N-acetyltransferase family protein [Haloarculaceae archaeon]